MRSVNTVKAFSFILALLLVLASIPMTVSAIDIWDIPALGDSSETQIAEGVQLTKFDTTGGKYGLQKINVLEVDLKNRNLSLEVVTGKYITSKMTMQNYVILYNSQHESEGKEMVAAVNGALWMTGSTCVVGQVASKIVTIPRGVVMHEGEILCSNETYEEGVGPFFAFAVTDDYVPIIGEPIVGLSLKNVTQNTTVAPNGLNRLPANNALMVYNGKMDSSNYALADAYEVIVTYKSGEYVNGGLIKGTVKAVGKKGGETPLDANTIILSARGNKIPLISGYSVGDELELSLSIHDTFRDQDDLWERVTECIPGHMLTVADGLENSLPDNSNYPCTMVGYKSDGTVVFIQNDGRQYIDWSDGLKVVNMPAFCKQLGINTMINLDGGGSSTMICNEEVVNRPSDGSPRPVINGIGIVVGPQREEQGEVPIVENGPFDPINVEFTSEEMVSRIGGDQNAANYEYDAVENAAKLYSSVDTNDAYLGFSYAGAYAAPSASTYKAIAIKYKTTPSLNGRDFEVFLCAGSIGGPTGGYSQMFRMTGDNEWHYGIIDCSSYSWWTGDIYMLRLDFIAGNSNKNDTVYVKSIQLCKSKSNAEKIAEGTFEGEESMEPTAALIALKDVSEYDLDRENMIITGVKEKSGEDKIREAFKKNSQNVKVVPYNNAKYAGTGTTVQYKEEFYTIVVKGDTDGTGKIDSTDYIKVKRHILNIGKLEGAFLDAADTDGNGKIDSTDYILIKRHMLNISTLG